LDVKISETIFICSNYTKSDLDLALSCDKIFVKEESLLQSKLKQLNKKIFTYTNFNNIVL